MFRTIILLGMTLCLFACSAVRPEEYAGTKPVLDPQAFFNGNFRSYGFFEDYRGKMTKHFSTRSSGSWKGNTGTMTEVFAFQDGDRKTRQWVFTKIDDANFIGTAPDVVGKARGTVSGNSLHWIYNIVLPVDGEDMEVTFDDWLTLIDERHMFSKVKIIKWGMPVGQLTMFFEKN